AEAVRQDLQHAVGGDAFAMAGQHLEQGEDHVLLAGTRHAFVDLQLLGDFQQLVRRHPLQVAQRVLREALRHARVRTRDVRLLRTVAVVLHAAVVARTVALAVAAVAEALAAVVAAAFAVGIVPVVLVAAVLASLARRCGLRRGVALAATVLATALGGGSAGGAGGRSGVATGLCRRHRQGGLDRRGGRGGFGSGGSGGRGFGDTLARALLGGCVIAPGRFRLGVLGQDWNSSLADASAR